MLPEDFFNELLAETKVQFEQSPVYQKQTEGKRKWNFAVCATPIVKGKGVMFGINWGGDDKDAQTKMPDGSGISKYHFIKQSRPFLEKHWGLNIFAINFNYTNLCFFRTPQEKDLVTKDYELSLPLFEKYIGYVNPPWILSIGGTNMKMLDSFGKLKNIKRHFDKEGKYKGHSAQFLNWNIFSVPHPSLRMTSDARQTIWEAVTEEMKKATPVKRSVSLRLI